MIQDKGLTRVQVVVDEEIDMKLEVFARENQISPIENVNVEIVNQLNVEENFEQFEYKYNLPPKKETTVDAEYVSPNSIKRNKVSPKEERVDDNFGKTETNFEQNNPITVQPINRRQVKVEEVPEKKVFGLGLSGIVSDFD